MRLCRYPTQAEDKERVARFLQATHHPPEIAAGLRLGLTYTLVEAWSEPRLRGLTTSLLVRLIPGAKGALAEALSRVFIRTNPLPPDEDTCALLKALLEHPATLASGNSRLVIDRLKDLLREGWSPGSST